LSSNIYGYRVRLIVKEDKKIYNEASQEGFKDYFCDATNKFDRLVNSLPERMWIE